MISGAPALRGSWFADYDVLFTNKRVVMANLGRFHQFGPYFGGKGSEKAGREYRDESPKGFGAQLDELVRTDDRHESVPYESVQWIKLQRLNVVVWGSPAEVEIKYRGGPWRPRRLGIKDSDYERLVEELPGLEGLKGKVRLE